MFKKHYIFVLFYMVLSFNVFGNIVEYYSKHVKGSKITDNFVVPKGLERAVDFWIDIYSKYDVNQIVIHDTDTFVVYDVVDVSDLDLVKDLSSDIKDEIIDSRVSIIKNKYSSILKELSLSNEDDHLSQESKEVFLKFKNIDDNNKFIEAARPGRIRAQKGQMSSFREAIYYSQLYIEDIENVLNEQGLPLELARIPYVESYYNPMAVSPRNAAGIWQFMKGTAKEYMKVSKHYDERKDPVASTYAAAKLLKQSYEYLWNEWPLAITSYNHGRFGMKRIVDRVGSKDISTIVKNYNSNTFGFASKNFYAGFLAVLYLDLNKNKFFGDISQADSTKYKAVQLTRPLKLSQLEALLGMDMDQIKRYNPAISRMAFETDAVMPKGAKIRMPKDLIENIRGINDYAKII